MYYLVLFLLIICSYLEIIHKLKSKKPFVIIYIVMTLMAMFRFGQVGDYFDYYYLFRLPANLKDPLFTLYTLFFNFLGVKYTFYIAVTEIIILGLAFPFFYKTCQGSCISLFVFYTYTFLLCPMSALRQAVCLSLLLFSYRLLVEKKKIPFFIIVLIGMFIHLSFFSVFILGLFYDKKIYNQKFIFYVVIIATLLFFSGLDIASGLRSSSSMENRSVSANIENPFDFIIQIILRLIIIIPIMLFKPKYGSDGYYAKAICVIGYIMYCLLASNILVAGRIEFFYRTFLCLFISYLSFTSTSKFRNAILYLFICVHIVLFFKNINSFISQGDYYPNVTMFNFPYISIFDKSEIDEYSAIDQYNYNE